MKRRFLCEPCDHRWWQHRHPNPGIRLIGFVMMVAGALQAAIGLVLVLR